MEKRKKKSIHSVSMASTLLPCPHLPKAGLVETPYILTGFSHPTYLSLHVTGFNRYTCCSGLTGCALGAEYAILNLTNISLAYDHAVVFI